MRPILQLTLAIVAQAADPLAAAERPNVVLILVDDLGWADPGCYGHRWHRTPHIDRLASEGVRFTSAYSPAPICSAARAAILTGNTPARLNFEFVTKAGPGRQRIDADVPLSTPPFTLDLPLTEQTVAERLAGLNYRTAFFGKWHVSRHYQGRYLAWHPDFGPHSQGFAVAAEDFGDHPYAWGRTTPPAAPVGEFPVDSMIQRVSEFIRGHDDGSFFLMASLFHVHTPVRNRCRWLVAEYENAVPVDAINRNARLEYAAFVETMDHHVGEILGAVEESGRRDDTLVVFMSDNGGHPEYTANAPLRGSKWNLYEGGIRVPLIARWPGRIAAAATCETPVIGYDLLPTFVELAGGQANDVDGVSITPSFDDPDWRPDRSLIWHFPYYHPETGFAQAKEHIGVDDFAVSRTRPHSAIRRGPLKLLTFAEDDAVELYDLSVDLDERDNLAAERPEVARELAAALREQLRAMNARFPAPRTNVTPGE